MHALSFSHTTADVDYTLEAYGEVLPILKACCVKCHGEVRQKGKLRLDSRSAAMKGGEEGAVIAEGNSRSP